MDIKNLKEVVVFAAKGYQAVHLAKADGKFDANDVMYAVPLLGSIGPMIQDIGMVIPEAKDLDAAEQQELIDAVKVECPDLATNAQVWLVVVAALNWLRSSKDLYLAIAAK